MKNYTQIKPTTFITLKVKYFFDEIYTFRISTSTGTQINPQQNVKFP